MSVLPYLTPEYRATVGAAGVLMGAVVLYALFLWLEDVMFSENKYGAAFHNLLFKRPRTLAGLFVIGLVLNVMIHGFIYRIMVVHGNIFDADVLAEAEKGVTTGVYLITWIGWMIYGIAILFGWVVNTVSRGHNNAVNITRFFPVAAAVLLFSRWFLPKIILVEIIMISTFFGVRGKA